MALQSGRWTAAKIFTDASNFSPRDSALRAVGWAAVARCRLPGSNREGWQYVCGTLPPGFTVAQGEAHAVKEAMQLEKDRLNAEIQAAKERDDSYGAQGTSF